MKREQRRKCGMSVEWMILFGSMNIGKRVTDYPTRLIDCTAV